MSGQDPGKPGPRGDIEDIKQVNADFYLAFERLDLEAMSEVWAHGDEVRCVHPGWPALEGWQEVRESWQTIFSNTDSIRFVLADVQVVLGDDLAWVFLTENIVTDGEDDSAAVAATNLYQRQGGRWRMVLHHASPTPAKESEREIDPTTLN
jgi:ketosteroid isomerase-like protein